MELESDVGRLLHMNLIDFCEILRQKQKGSDFISFEKFLYSICTSPYISKAHHKFDRHICIIFCYLIANRFSIDHMDFSNNSKSFNHITALRFILNKDYYVQEDSFQEFELIKKAFLQYINNCDNLSNPFFRYLHQIIDLFPERVFASLKKEEIVDILKQGPGLIHSKSGLKVIQVFGLFVNHINFLVTDHKKVLFSDIASCYDRIFILDSQIQTVDLLKAFFPAWIKLFRLLRSNEVLSTIFENQIETISLLFEKSIYYCSYYPKSFAWNGLLWLTSIRSGVQKKRLMNTFLQSYRSNELFEFIENGNKKISDQIISVMNEDDQSIPYYFFHMCDTLDAIINNERYAIIWTEKTFQSNRSQKMIEFYFSEQFSNTIHMNEYDKELYSIINPRFLNNINDFRNTIECSFKTYVSFSKRIRSFIELFVPFFKIILPKLLENINDTSTFNIISMFSSVSFRLIIKIAYYYMIFQNNHLKNILKCSDAKDQLRESMINFNTNFQISEQFFCILGSIDLIPSHFHLFVSREFGKILLHSVKDGFITLSFFIMIENYLKDLKTSKTSLNPIFYHTLCFLISELVAERQVMFTNNVVILGKFIQIVFMIFRLSYSINHLCKGSPFANVLLMHYPLFSFEIVNSYNKVSLPIHIWKVVWSYTSIINTLFSPLTLKSFKSKNRKISGFFGSDRTPLGFFHTQNFIYSYINVMNYSITDLVPFLQESIQYNHSLINFSKVFNKYLGDSSNMVNDHQSLSPLLNDCLDLFPFLPKDESFIMFEKLSSFPTEFLSQGYQLENYKYSFVIPNFGMSLNEILSYYCKITLFKENECQLLVNIFEYSFDHLIHQPFDQTKEFNHIVNNMFLLLTIINSISITRDYFDSLENYIVTQLSHFFGNDVKTHFILCCFNFLYSHHNESTKFLFDLIQRIFLVSFQDCSLIINFIEDYLLVFLHTYSLSIAFSQIVCLYPHVIKKEHVIKIINSSIELPTIDGFFEICFSGIIKSFLKECNQDDGEFIVKHIYQCFYKFNSITKWDLIKIVMDTGFQIRTRFHEEMINDDIRFFTMFSFAIIADNENCASFINSKKLRISSLLQAPVQKENIMNYSFVVSLFLWALSTKISLFFDVFNNNLKEYVLKFFRNVFSSNRHLFLSLNKKTFKNIIEGVSNDNSFFSPIKNLISSPKQFFSSSLSANNMFFYKRIIKVSPVSIPVIIIEILISTINEYTLKPNNFNPAMIDMIISVFKILASQHLHSSPVFVNAWTQKTESSSKIEIFFKISLHFYNILEYPLFSLIRKSISAVFSKYPNQITDIFFQSTIPPSLVSFLGIVLRSQNCVSIINAFISQKVENLINYGHYFALLNEIRSFSFQNLDLDDYLFELFDAIMSKWKNEGYLITPLINAVLESLRTKPTLEKLISISSIFSIINLLESNQVKYLKRDILRNIPCVLIHDFSQYIMNSIPQKNNDELMKMFLKSIKYNPHLPNINLVTQFFSKKVLVFPIYWLDSMRYLVMQHKYLPISENQFIEMVHSVILADQKDIKFHLIKLIIQLINNGIVLQVLILEMISNVFVDSFYFDTPCMKHTIIFLKLVLNNTKSIPESIISDIISFFSIRLDTKSDLFIAHQILLSVPCLNDILPFSFLQSMVLFYQSNPNYMTILDIITVFLHHSASNKCNIIPSIMDSLFEQSYKVIINYHDLYESQIVMIIMLFINNIPINRSFPRISDNKKNTFLKNDILIICFDYILNHNLFQETDIVLLQYVIENLPKYHIPSRVLKPFFVLLFKNKRDLGLCINNINRILSDMKSLIEECEKELFIVLSECYVQLFHQCFLYPFDTFCKSNENSMKHHPNSKTVTNLIEIMFSIIKTAPKYIFDDCLEKILDFIEIGMEFEKCLICFAVDVFMKSDVSSKNRKLVLYKIIECEISIIDRSFDELVSIIRIMPKEEQTLYLREFISILILNSIQNTRSTCIYNSNTIRKLIPIDLNLALDLLKQLLPQYFWKNKYIPFLASIFHSRTKEWILFFPFFVLDNNMSQNALISCFEQFFDHNFSGVYSSLLASLLNTQKPSDYSVVFGSIIRVCISKSIHLSFHIAYKAIRVMDKYDALVHFFQHNDEIPMGIIKPSQSSDTILCQSILQHGIIEKSAIYLHCLGFYEPSLWLLSSLSHRSITGNKCSVLSERFSRSTHCKTLSPDLLLPMRSYSQEYDLIVDSFNDAFIQINNSVFDNIIQKTQRSQKSMLYSLRKHPNFSQYDKERAILVVCISKYLNDRKPTVILSETLKGFVNPVFLHIFRKMESYLLSKNLFCEESYIFGESNVLKMQPSYHHDCINIVSYDSRGLIVCTSDYLTKSYDRFTNNIVNKIKECSAFIILGSFCFNQYLINAQTTFCTTCVDCYCQFLKLSHSTKSPDTMESCSRLVFFLKRISLGCNIELLSLFEKNCIFSEYPNSLWFPWIVVLFTLSSNFEIQKLLTPLFKSLSLNQLINLKDIDEQRFNYFFPLTCCQFLNPLHDYFEKLFSLDIKGFLRFLDLKRFFYFLKQRNDSFDLNHVLNIQELGLCYKNLFPEDFESLLNPYIQNSLKNLETPIQIPTIIRNIQIENILGFGECLQSINSFNPISFFSLTENSLVSLHCFRESSRVFCDDYVMTHGILTDGMYANFLIEQLGDSDRNRSIVSLNFINSMNHVFKLSYLTQCRNARFCYPKPLLYIGKYTISQCSDFDSFKTLYEYSVEHAKNTLDEDPSVILRNRYATLYDKYEFYSIRRNYLVSSASSSIIRLLLQSRYPPLSYVAFSSIDLLVFIIPQELLISKPSIEESSFRLSSSMVHVFGENFEGEFIVSMASTARALLENFEVVRSYLELLLIEDGYSIEETYKSRTLTETKVIELSPPVSVFTDLSIYQEWAELCDKKISIARSIDCNPSECMPWF